MAYIPQLYTTLDRMKARVPAVEQLFLSGDVIDTQAVAEVILDASSRAVSLLLGGFTIEQINTLSTDPLFVGAVTDIAIGFAFERNPEWRDEKTGKFPYCERIARGEEVLKTIGRSYRRLGGEMDAGENLARAVPAVSSDPPRGW